MLLQFKIEKDKTDDDKRNTISVKCDDNVESFIVGLFMKTDNILSIYASEKVYTFIKNIGVTIMLHLYYVQYFLV